MVYGIIEGIIPCEAYILLVMFACSSGIDLIRDIIIVETFIPSFTVV